MRISSFVLAAVAAAVLVTAASADLGTKYGVARLATLSGSTEVPAGDPDGNGRALFRFDVREGLVCFSITIHGVDSMVAAHIHRASAGQAGPVILPLPTPAKVGANTFASKGCVSAARSLIRDMIANPQSYYYNTHNAKYPAGVVRGQLRR